MNKIEIKHVRYIFIDDRSVSIDLLEDLWRYLSCNIIENITEHIDDETKRREINK